MIVKEPRYLCEFSADLKNALDGIAVSKRMSRWDVYRNAALMADCEASIPIRSGLSPVRVDSYGVKRGDGPKPSRN